MIYKIIISPSANKDILTSFEYYREIAGKNVANRFFQDFKNAVKILSKISHFQKIYDDFHRLPLKIFPFILIYKIDDENKTVRIYRVFHTSQNPEKYPSI